MLDKARKLPTVLPMQYVDMVATITRRAPSAELLARRAKHAAERAAELAAHPERAAKGPGEDDDGNDDDEDVYDITLSSETPVDRGWYVETLDHSSDAVNLERSEINLLWNHNSDEPIGRISNLKAKGKKLDGDMRFYSRPFAQDKRSMVDEGLREVSVGYSVQSYEYTPGTSEHGDAYRATRWTPLEGSIAPVPADYTAGAQKRTGDNLEFPVSVRSTTPPTAVKPEVRHMDPTAQAAADAAAKAKAQLLPTEIARLAHQHKMGDKVVEWLEAGHSLEKVREIILEAKATPASSQIAPGTGTGIDLPAADQRAYSYARAIAAAADQAEGKRGVKCLETEVSEELERTMPGTYKRHGGLYVPMSLRNAGVKGFSGAERPITLTPQQRDAFVQFARTGVTDSVTANALKELVFTEFGGELINILRNMCLTVQMGARVLTGLSSPIAFPRQTQDVTAYWVSENPGTDVTASNVKDDLVTLTPRTLQATTAYSRQLLVQASVDVESMTRESIAAAHALGIDLSALHGTGVNNQPLGIYNQPNVGTVDFSSSSYGDGSDHIAYTGVVQMEVGVATSNALLGSLGFLTTPGIAGDAKKTLKFPAAAIAQGGVLWDGKILEGEMDGYTARATNQISSTMGASGAPSGGSNHGLIFGNWADLIIAQFGGAMEMIVDPYSKKKQGLIEVTSFQMADVAVRHPVSFSVSINLLK
jgi:HK97 family phage major capsid protein